MSDREEFLTARQLADVLQVSESTVRRLAAKHGIRTNPAFAGTYTYRANADFEQIFPTFLEGMPEGGLVMCHPGFVDAELERLDPLTTLREREYAYFCSDGVVEALKAHDFALN